MRIAWFTPLSRTSSIGRFSVAVTASLSRLAYVDLCYFDSQDIRESRVTARRFSSAASITADVWNGYDIVVYNLGNYLPFHREIYLLSRRWPGVCILHDFVMHHFFADYYFNYLHDSNAYSLLMQHTYGFQAPVGERAWETAEVVHYPLFEEAARGALGIITHSEFFKRRVQECFAGPVARIPLACDAVTRSTEGSRSEPSKTKLGVAADQLLILTVGHVNRNKQIESALDALAQIRSDLGSFIYAIVGPVSADYERELKSAAREKGLGDVVRFLGQVSDEVLFAYLSAADVCINLRFPITEGASGSLVEQMAFGKPVIVNDVGCFSELPDECVIKVPANSDGRVARALRRLANDAPDRIAMGARAKAFAQTEFHPDRYARQFMEFMWEVQSAKPILSLSDRVGVELGRMGAHADARILDVIAREINEIFVEKPSHTDASHR